MREICMSGSMSGEGKPPAASRSRSSALPRLYAGLGDAAHVWCAIKSSHLGENEHKPLVINVRCSSVVLYPESGQQGPSRIMSPTVGVGVLTSGGIFQIVRGPKETGHPLVNRS
jgi:hypothetical protein